MCTKYKSLETTKYSPKGHIYLEKHMINRPKTLDLLQHVLTENELLFESFLNKFFLSYFSTGSVVKNLPANAGDVGLIPGSGRSPREGNGKILQYSCLEKFTEEPGRL